MIHPRENRMRTWLCIFVTGLISGAALWAHLAALSTGAAEPLSSSPLVVRIFYRDIRELDALQSLDLWEYNNLEERYVLASVDTAVYQSLIDRGWKVTIDQEFSAKLNRAAYFFGQYRNVIALYALLESVNQSAPQLTEIVDYGPSHCLAQGGCTTPGGDSWSGVPLRAIRVTNETVPGASTIEGGVVSRGEKPVFFLMAGIHSREITTPELAVRLLETLIDGYGTDADITWLVDYHEIWIVPTINPDGHWLVELGAEKKYGGLPFYHRKNFNNDTDIDGTADCPVWPPSSYEQFGIDLNRNHSFGWGPPGSSSQPCNLTYRGPTPASEVEVMMLESLIKALFPDQRGPGLNEPAPVDTTGLFITLHSFSNLVLWPWGNIESPAPNRDDLKAIGDKFAKYNGYLSCQPSQCLYMTNGSSDDWAYGELGIPAFTFEVGNEFMPPYAEIDSQQWPDNGPALLYAAKIARAPYLLVHGPDLLDLRISPDGGQFVATATADDTHNGGEKIVGARYTIDKPPWQDGAQLIPLQPTDGTFNAPQESVEAILDLGELEPGRHILYAQGQDATGSWGAVSAAFFELENGGTDDELVITFNKTALEHLAAPGGMVSYRIAGLLTAVESGSSYTFEITDQLPNEITIAPETILVNGAPRPELYNPDTNTLHYETTGIYTQPVSLSITFSTTVADTTAIGLLLVNEATATGTVNDSFPMVISASDSVLVAPSVTDLYLPVAVGN